MTPQTIKNQASDILTALEAQSTRSISHILIQAGVLPGELFDLVREFKELKLQADWEEDIPPASLINYLNDNFESSNRNYRLSVLKLVVDGISDLEAYELREAIEGNGDIVVASNEDLVKIQAIMQGLYDSESDPSRSVKLDSALTKIARLTK